MKTIFLHGALAAEFGSSFRLDVASVGEAVRALEANFRGRFYKFIKEGSYVVQRNLLDRGMGESELPMKIGSDEIHITPVIQGAKSKGKGILTAVLGIALIGVAVFNPIAATGAFSLGESLGATAFSVAGFNISFGQVALWGVSLALQGVSALLSPTPKVGSYSNRERPDEMPSFLFNGPVNTTEEGGARPLVYGLVETGSVVIDGEIFVERLPT